MDQVKATKGLLKNDAGTCLIWFFVTLAAANVAAADQYEAPIEIQRDDYIHIVTEKHVEREGAWMGSKLLRGLTNIATGWCEIPRQIGRSYTRNGIFLCVPLGLFRGIIMTGYRTGFGVFDTAFFMAPVHGSYKSMLKPDYVWQSYPDHSIYTQPAASKKEMGGTHEPSKLDIQK